MSLEELYFILETFELFASLLLLQQWHRKLLRQQMGLGGAEPAGLGPPWGSTRVFKFWRSCTGKVTKPVKITPQSPLSCKVTQKLGFGGGGRPCQGPDPKGAVGHTMRCFSSVQSVSCVWLFETPWTAARLASPSITNSQSLFKLMSIESVMPSSHLILCHPLLLLPSVFPSIRVFSNESALCTMWPKYWSFRFSISPSNEYSGLISFRIDWFDLLAVQGTLKSLHQHHKSINSLVLAFFMVKVSHPYMTTGKTISLTRRTFVGKIMSLLFNMLSSLVIAFLPRSKHLLISWLQSPSAVILEPKKIKSVTVSIVFPYIFHEVMGLDALFLVFWMLSFKLAFSLSSFTFIKRLFSFSLLSAIRVVSSAYLRLLIFVPEILIPACASSSPWDICVCQKGPEFKELWERSSTKERGLTCMGAGFQCNKAWAYLRPLQPSKAPWWLLSFVVRETRNRCIPKGALRTAAQLKGA